MIVLDKINASLEAQKGFCLHPLFQIDEDFIGSVNNLEQIIGNDFYVLTLAMEYRSVANEYLSPKGILKPEQIRLSPLKDVNDMLVADKVQNRKDFELNKEKYPNADILDGYFKTWLARLNVNENQYQQLISFL